MVQRINYWEKNRSQKSLQSRASKLNKESSTGYDYELPEVDKTRKYGNVPNVIFVYVDDIRVLEWSDVEFYRMVRGIASGFSFLGI